MVVSTFPFLIMCWDAGDFSEKNFFFFVFLFCFYSEVEIDIKLHILSAIFLSQLHSRKSTVLKCFVLDVLI